MRGSRCSIRCTVRASVSDHGASDRRHTFSGMPVAVWRACSPIRYTSRTGSMSLTRASSEAPDSCRGRRSKPFTTDIRLYGLHHDDGQASLRGPAESMNCAQADKLLIDDLYQELSSIQARALQLHVRSCSGCSSSLEGLLSTRRVLRQLQLREPPSPLLDAIILAAWGSSRLPRGRGRARTSFWSAVHHPAFVAAVVVCVVCFGVAVQEWPAPTAMFEADRRDADGPGSVAMLPGPQPRPLDESEVAPPSPSQPVVGRSSAATRPNPAAENSRYDLSKRRPVKIAARAVARCRPQPEGRECERSGMARPISVSAKPSSRDLLARCDRAAASKRCGVALRCYNRLLLRSPKETHRVKKKARGCWALLHQRGMLSRNEARMHFPGLVPLFKTSPHRGKAATPAPRSHKE